MKIGSRGLARARQFHDHVEVALVLGEFFDVVALAVGFAAAAKSSAYTASPLANNCSAAQR